MANGNLNLKNLSIIVGFVVIIVGATITFANKVDRSEVKICMTEVEKKINDGDTVLHRRVEKVDQKIDKTRDDLLKLISENQKEILGILKSNRP